MRWDDPEGWDGEGSGRGAQDGEHMYTYGDGSILDVHQQMNGKESSGTYTQWSITQPLKRIHLNQF